MLENDLDFVKLYEKLIIIFLIIIAIGVFSSTVNAEIIYQEDFETWGTDSSGDEAPIGWEIHWLYKETNNDGGKTYWHKSPQTDLSPYCAKINHNKPKRQDDKLISPTIDLTYCENVTLSFWTESYGVGPWTIIDHNYIDIRPVGGNWVRITDLTDHPNNDWDSEITLDISAFDHQVIQLRFHRYFIGFGWGYVSSWAVDNLTINGNCSLNQGLIGYWKFDEGSGSIAYDSSGFGNHGQINGSSWQICNEGSALYFDGINDYVNCGNDTIFNLDYNVTFSAWIKKEQGGGWNDGQGHDGIISTDTIPDQDNGYSGFRFGLLDNFNNQYQLGIEYGDGDGGSPSDRRSLKTTAGIIDHDVWSHIVGICSGPNNFSLYLDGVKITDTYLQGSGNDMVWRGDSFVIGVAWRPYYFKGIIDEVRLYNRVLSDNEIQFLYDTIKPCEVASDIDAPVTTLNIDNPNVPVDSTSHYITSETNISLSATDPGGSGISYSEYMIWYQGIWSGPFIYNGSFNLAGECVHFLLYRSVDNAGNIEDWNNHTFYVDNSAPNSWVEIGDPSWGNWITPDTPVTIYADDSGPCSVSNSTPPKVYYSIDGGITWIVVTCDWDPFLGLWYIILDLNCSCNLTWYCIDGLDLIGFPYLPPCGGYCFIVTDTIDPWGMPGGNYYTEPTGEIHVSGDTGVVVGPDIHPFNGNLCYYIVYRTWWNVTGEWSPWMIGPCNSSVTLFFQEECMHYLEFYAIDDLGNNESQPNWINLHNITLYVDLTPPIFEWIVPDHGFYPVDETHSYLKCSTPLELIADDRPSPPCKSGLDRMFWRYEYQTISYPQPEDPNAVDGSEFASLYNYSNPEILNHWWYYNSSPSSINIIFDEECQHDVYYFGKDNVWNHGSVEQETFYVDCTPPVTTTIHPTTFLQLNATWGVLRLNDQISLTADDGQLPCSSGVENLFWRYHHQGTDYPFPGESNAINGLELGILYGYTDPEILNHWWYYNTTPSTTDFIFQQTGRHDLYYWSKDNVCNNEQIHHHVYLINDCQDEVWVDDNFNLDTPGYWYTHFNQKQLALDWLDINGIAHIYDGYYYQNIIVDDYPCDNTGMLQYGAYGCFPIDESAIIGGTELIKVDDVTIKYLEYLPKDQGAVIIDEQISGTTLRCNKFNQDCDSDAIGVYAKTGSIVNAQLNWWGQPNGPTGGIMDDGKTADGYGVKVVGEVYVEPWLGIHAEITKPAATISVDVGTPVYFDATDSWAYTYGTCCQQPEPLHMQYEWDFDDGTYSHTMTTSHVFDTPGTYEVNLMVDAPGIPGLYENTMFDWDNITIHVTTPGTPLTVSADGPDLQGYETMVGVSLQLYGDAYGGNGQYLWQWDFGDQSPTEHKQNPVHTFQKLGTYTATLTVTSGDEQVSDQTTIIVHDIEELIVNLTDISAIVDVETGFICTIQGGIGPYTYEWDFGDGSISIDSNPTHIYEETGTYLIQLIVTDNHGSVMIDTAFVTVKEESDIEEIEILDVNANIFVSAVIKTGDQPVDWVISVDGKFVFGEIETVGSLPSQMTTTVKTGVLFGIGKVSITVEAEAISKKYAAFLFGPFFLNLNEV